MKLILTVFLLHYLADWILQSPKMGREKSSKFKVLCTHILIIFITLFLGTLYFLNPLQALYLSLINALTHAIIDWNIWRLYRITVYLRHRKEIKDMGKDRAIAYLQRHWKYWLDPVFGHFLGFDQLLHFIILYLLYNQ